MECPSSNSPRGAAPRLWPRPSRALPMELPTEIFDALIPNESRVGFMDSALPRLSVWADPSAAAGGHPG